jgi:hypothetical protein
MNNFRPTDRVSEQRQEPPAMHPKTLRRVYQQPAYEVYLVDQSTTGGTGFAEDGDAQVS